MPEQAHGKKVIVTGGGRGIGRAIVVALAAEGYDVAFSCRSAAGTSAALCRELADRYQSQTFEALEADLANKRQVEALAAEFEAMPGLYGLVHNAGTTADALAAMLDQGRAETLMQVNFWSMTRLTKAALRPMLRARAGRIVAIGSITATRGARGNAAYAASKGAMASYMRALAVEVASRGVTANVVAPGHVDTEMLAPYASGREAVERQIPVGRYATAAEVAALVCFLAGPSAACITGAEIPVDGGLSAAIGIRQGP